MPHPAFRPVAFVLVAVLLDTMAIGMIAPVLPARVAAFTTSADEQTWWVGALSVAWGAAHFMAASFLGALSDRHGRRPVLLLSIAGLACDLLLMAFATSPWMMLAGRLVGGITASGFLVGSAYAADVTPPGDRSRAMGFVGAAAGVGLILGPVVGGLLGERDPRFAFMVAAGVAAANAAYVALVLPESRSAAARRDAGAGHASGGNPLASFGVLRSMRGVGAIAIVFCLAKLAQFTLQNVWVLYTQFRFEWGPKEAGIALFTIGVAAAVAQGLLLGRMLRRFGERRTVLAGLAMGALTMVAFGLATRGWMVYAIVLLALPGLAVVPALQGLASTRVDAARQGLAMGALHSMGSLMAVVAPVVATPLLAAVNQLPATDWRSGAPLHMAGLLLVLAWTIAWLRVKQNLPSVPGATRTAHPAQ